VTNRETKVIGLIDTMCNIRRLPLQSQWSLLRLSLNAGHPSALGLQPRRVPRPQRQGCCSRACRQAALVSLAWRRGAVHVCAICSGVTPPALPRGRRLLAHGHRKGRGLWTAAVSKGAWFMSFYCEVSCALQHCNGLMYAKSAERLICAQGRHFMPGAAVPSPWGGSV
jgi:hypothetical protein